MRLGDRFYIYIVLVNFTMIGHTVGDVSRLSVKM